MTPPLSRESSLAVTEELAGTIARRWAGTCHHHIEYPNGRTSCVRCGKRPEAHPVVHTYRGFSEFAPVPLGAQALCGHRKRIPPAFLSNADALASPFPRCVVCTDLAGGA